MRRIPSKVATRLLATCSGDSIARFVLSDLEEEFLLVAAREGWRGARAWYWSQVFRSVVPLVIAAVVRSGGRSRAVLVLLLTGAPVLLFDPAWSALLSLVPMKAGLERGADYFAVACILATLCGSLAGLSLGREHSRWFAGMMSTYPWLAHELSRGREPAGYPAVLAATVFFTYLFAARYRARAGDLS